jgi:lipopolysaccharide transport system ATP-binding protein
MQYGGERHELPPGAVIGVIGDNGSGASEVLQAAGGRFLGPGHRFDLSPAPVICIAYSLDLRDAYSRCAFAADATALRRSGSIVLVASHDQHLLRQVADEVWWVDHGRVIRKGDAREVLDAYTRHTAERLRRAGTAAPDRLTPSMRRGDGRARVMSLTIRDARDEAASTVRSGDPTTVRVQVRYENPVPDPVVGIMIRTRIGMEVYGTNTELENVAVGPCEAGDTRTVSFAFACDLCPGSYSITAASHDPDGVWHDWLEDAIAFLVTDTRYTAGVANLKAAVTCSRG